jgi:type VI secretion system secreted protein Hcp
MAVDMFLNLAGIGGDSVDSKHKGEISIVSWSWGMSQSGSTHLGPGSGSGKVSVSDITLTKYIDTATPNLLKACCLGTHIKNATLTVRKAGGNNPLEYLTIKLFDIIVSSVSTGASGGEDKLTENLTLNFGQFEVDYIPQTATGSAGATIVMTFNIQTNAEKLTS